MFRRALVLTASTAICALMAVVPPAQAAVDRFMQEQRLGAGHAYASYSRHTGISRVEGAADHTWCPSLAQNYEGYTSQPRGGDNRTAIGPCGPGYRSWQPNGTESTLFRGAAYNPNSTTTDYFGYADYIYG